MEFTQDKTFDKINFTEAPLPKGEHENCIFSNCDFSKTDFTDMKFIDCKFSGCNLSLTKLVRTTFMDVKFKDCKMLGMLFEHCSEFGLAMNFENCNLNHASFFKTKIKKTIFKNTMLQEVDFAEADLTSAVFEQCDLLNSKFEQTLLEKVDMRTSFNYIIDPELNRIKKAKFSLSGIVGLLSKYDIQVDN